MHSGGGVWGQMGIVNRLSRDFHIKLCKKSSHDDSAQARYPTLFTRPSSPCVVGVGLEIQVSPSTLTLYIYMYTPLSSAKMAKEDFREPLTMAKYVLNIPTKV